LKVEDKHSRIQILTYKNLTNACESGSDQLAFVGEGIFLRRILKNKNKIVMILSASTDAGHPRQAVSKKSLKSYES
jgi:hypothetical protein